MEGQLVCRLHGGATARSLAAAKRRIALRKVTDMLGVPIEIDPAEALIEQVHLAAGNEFFLRHQVQLLQDEGADRMLGLDGVDVRVKLWNDERERLARMSKLAVDAGIAERQVRIREAEGAAIAAMLVLLLDHPRLALSGQQRAVGRQVARQLLLDQLAAKRPRPGDQAADPAASGSLLLDGELLDASPQERNG
jgi:hypothetical protein